MGGIKKDVLPSTSNSKADFTDRQILHGDTADQVFCQFCRRHGLEPRPDDLRKNFPDTVSGYAPIKDPGASIRVAHVSVSMSCSSRTPRYCILRTKSL